jgi:hypothetical protein
MGLSTLTFRDFDETNAIVSAIAMLSIGLNACHDGSSHLEPNNYKALKKNGAPSASPAVAEMRLWAKSGQLAGCYIAHGDFVAAENGYVYLTGGYHYGKKAGIWRWYDRNGAVVKTVKYCVLLLALTTALCGCAQGKAKGLIFPAVSVGDDLKVYEATPNGERMVCKIETADLSRKAIENLRETFPEGWKPASPVSHAPAFRVTTGDTEILFLRHGIVIAFRSEGKAKTLSRQVEDASPESLAKDVCNLAIPWGKQHLSRISAGH